MSSDVEHAPDQTAASLVSGILGDLQKLVEQQFQLTRREIDEELRQRAAASMVLGLGVGILFLGAFVACLAVSHLLHWATLPPETDLAWLPLWGCHAVVAVTLAIVGGVVTQMGRTQFNNVDSQMNPMTELMKEETPWTTHRK